MYIQKWGIGAYWKDFDDKKFDTKCLVFFVLFCKLILVSYKDFKD